MFICDNIKKECSDNEKNYKKFIVLSVLAVAQWNFSIGAEASDVYIGGNNERNIYITYESVVYYLRGGNLGKVRVKIIDNEGNEAFNDIISFTHYEGDWWYGMEGVRGGYRVYDSEIATTILNWLLEHRGEAQQTSKRTAVLP